MKKKTLLIMLLVALFVPLAMNAQTKKLKRSINGATQLEMRVSPKAMPSNPMLSKLESAKEAALEELNTRAGNRGNTTVTASRITSSSATWTGSGDESWNVSIVCNTGGLNQAVTNGYAQFGTQRNPATSGTFSTSDIPNTITSVAVDCASYQGRGTVSVTVGGVAFGESQTIPSWSSNAGGTRTFTGSAEGAITVTMTNASNGRAMYIKSITVTYLEPGCSAPEDFAASNVTMNSVTLSWTETGTSEEWAILYMCEEDTEAQVEFVDTNPFTLTGLNPATYYIAEVIPMCGDYDQESDVIEFTTQDLPCPRPANLSASDIAMSSATVSWDGDAPSYTLQYRIAASNGEARLFQDFESGSFDDWTTVRNGGGTTSTDWVVIDPNETFSSSPGDAHSGDYLAMSRSWASNAYNVDNWLISPQFTLGGTLKYWVRDDGEYHETYYICVSTGSNAVREFTQIYAPGNATDSWTEVTVDLSAYEGRTGYIAFHHADYDQDYLFIDDIGVYGEGEPAGEWVTVNNITSPYNITGLDPETIYEWQVQAVCGGEDGESVWVTGEPFTTGSACDAPVALTATEITNSTAALSWTGNTETYNVQYREVDPTAPVTVILTAGDIWGDGSGYQMLLDADATAYGTVIPETGALTTSGNASAATYAEFEYKIPTNADGAMATSNIVINNSISIQIPAGTYDWCITNPTPGDRIWIASSNGNVGGRQDDYVFEPGKTYEFVVDVFGTNDGVDVTITDDGGEWTTVNNVTNPYTLTNLSSNTTYMVQVQGVNCDGNGSTTDWSAGVSFTTLDGILVESITADDVEVLINETATITNLVVLPEEATNPVVTYTSNDETIATVDENGVVTGVAVGETTLTIAATDGSGVTGTINVTVKGVDVTEITAEDVTLVNGETATISYTVTPDNATDPSVTFTSADETIATVDASGVVTGVGVGETTITIASVSTPEVTTTLNVTVTSNPEAVQFTVNAPAIAQAGDVITVEGVLTAPTSGTYGGFNGLILDITYDNTAFQYVANSTTYGPVAQAAQQLNGFLSPGTLDNAVQLAISIFNEGSFVTTEGVVFSAQFTVLEGAEGDFEFTAEPHGTGNFDHEGTSILYEATPSTVTIAVSQAFVLEIDPYEGEKDNYYLIASPVGNVTANLVEGLQTPDFDFYSFDQTAELEWINHRDETEYELESGVGYLYANNTGTDLTFHGIPTTEETVTVTLTYADAADGLDFPDWNLVGNPFEVSAYPNQPFYAMENGAFVPKDANAELPAMNGAFVVGSADVTSVTFSRNAGSKASKLALNLTNSGKLIDRAIVSFRQGQQLPKFQLFKNNTRVYIEQDNKDYAIVNANEMGEMPVSFKAESNGTYTMSFTNEEVEFSYLHLIDNMTGNDVDLLVNPSYSFEAKTTDYASRFKLVFATGSANSDEFAFISNGELIINGEGTLQVFDVLGRRFLTQDVTTGNCQLSTAHFPAGVYMIQLVNGENTKTQKIVVK